MAFDVSDFRSFYATPLGKVAGRLVGRIIRQRWDNCAGFSMLGVGYATPYLTVFREEAVRVLAFMPAEQGVVNWPPSGASSSALVETMAMPLPDACIDRALLVHALETVEHPRQLLGEIWRILTPGGRVIVVVPSRGGLWTRIDSTPFGHGQPFSRAQLREMMRETLFSPIHWGEALYVPPSPRPMFLRAATAIERIGGRFALPGGGVYLVEATKQLYRPVGARKVARERPVLAPVLAPTQSCVQFADPTAH
jgi:SAM-dependent methyltransferase